jgi:hypothetical protein
MPPDISDREIALLAAHRARPLDPLKIYYVVLLPEEPLEDTSPFQGFNRPGNILTGPSRP